MGLRAAALEAKLRFVLRQPYEAVSDVVIVHVLPRNHASRDDAPASGPLVGSRARAGGGGL
jgi:hypothetical protein